MAQPAQDPPPMETETQPSVQYHQPRRLSPKSRPSSRALSNAPQQQPGDAQVISTNGTVVYKPTDPTVIPKRLVKKSEILKGYVIFLLVALVLAVVIFVVLSLFFYAHAKNNNESEIERELKLNNQLLAKFQEKFDLESLRGGENISSISGELKNFPLGPKLSTLPKRPIRVPPQPSQVPQPGHV